VCDLDFLEHIRLFQELTISRGVTINLQLVKPLHCTRGHVHGVMDLMPSAYTPYTGGYRPEMYHVIIVEYIPWE